MGRGRSKKNNTDRTSPESLRMEPSPNKENRHGIDREAERFDGKKLKRLNRGKSVHYPEAFHAKGLTARGAA